MKPNMTTKTFKPEGYNSVSPYFIVDEAEKLIELLSKLFNGKVLRKYEHADGTIMHAEVQIDDSILMLSNSTEMYPANQHMMHVYVRDVDETFQNAITLGCKPLQEPSQKNIDGDTDRRGSFIDFAGNHWSVATAY